MPKKIIFNKEEIDKIKISMNKYFDRNKIYDLGHTLFDPDPSTFWKNEIKNIMHSEKYRNEFCLSVGFNLDKVLHDELITRKLQMKYQSNYKPIPEFENSLIFTPMNYRKNLHLIRALSGTNRLAVLLSIYEFRKTIEEFWGKKFVDEFGSEIGRAHV